MRYARVNEDGTVAEIIEPWGDHKIEDLYHPDFVKTCHLVGGDVQEGWVKKGKTFSPPQPDE